MRNDRRPKQIGRLQRIELRPGIGDDLLRIRYVESEQLPKDCSAEFGVREDVVCRKRVRHVANERGARGADIANRSKDRCRGIAGRAASKRHQIRRPRSHGSGRRDLMAHPRQLEVRMRVDETGQNGNVAKVDYFDRIGRLDADGILSRARGLNAAAVHQHPAIAGRRRHDR
jgi:hypothetical protein